MTINIPDEWKLDSGLRETMDLEIHSAYFATSADYQGGRVFQLFLIGSDESGEPVELRMSVGADWNSTDGGRTIIHPTKKRVNKNSVYGHFINAAIEIDDFADGTTLRDALFGRGNPLIADIWVGLKIHLDLTEIKFGKNIDNIERLLPTHFLGISTESAPMAQQAAAPPPMAPPVAPPVAAVPQTLPPQPPAAPPAIPTVPLPVAPLPATVPPTPATPTPQQMVAAAQAQAAVAQNGSPLFQEMIELAKASSTHQAFMEAAFARPDVLADEELAIQVADETKLWQLARA